MIKLDQLCINNSSGSIKIDLIRSYLSPGKEYLLRLLKEFENGSGNYYISDECDEWWYKLEREIALLLGIDVKKINMHVLEDEVYQEDQLIDYPNTLDWMVFIDMSFASGSPLLPEDVPFIREFLNTPPGQEKEAYEQWQDYWSKVDFDERRKYAPM